MTNPNEVKHPLMAGDTIGRLTVYTTPMLGETYLLPDGAGVADWITLVNKSGDARRLAACWNFCDRVATVGLEAITDGLFGLFLVGAAEQGEIKKLRFDLAELVVQRDATQALAEEAYKLLQEILTADDLALASMRELGVEVNKDAIGLTERIRALLEGGAA